MRLVLLGGGTIARLVLEHLQRGELDGVEVVAVGTPGSEVRFDIGSLRTRVPMLETAVVTDPRGDRATWHPPPRARR